MKLEKETQQPLIDSHEFEKGSFGIDQEDMPMVMNLLRNQIYSNKPLAVIREYTTNAADSHVDAGIPDREIIVTIPSQMNPIFAVRDFGGGLSHDQVLNVYVKYCKSTKRNSNAVTGQLGIGCKSGFAYGDSFTIVSYHEGKKLIYSASIDEKLAGTVTLLSSEETDEESGMEIIVPIRDEDINTFKKEAEKLFSFFDSPLKVKGSNDFKNYTYDPDLEGDDWQIAYSSDAAYNSAVAKMGNIGYQIDYNLIADYYYNSGDFKNFNVDIRTVLSFSGTRIRFDIGDLDIAPSREALEYTNKTKENIAKKAVNIIGDVRKFFNQQFDVIEDYWEVKERFNEYRNTINYSMRGILGSSITWNGIKISDSYISLDERYGNRIKIGNFGKFSVCSYDKNHTNANEDYFRVVQMKNYTIINCREAEVICFINENDGFTPQSINRRMRTIFRQNEKLVRVVAITYSDKKERVEAEEAFHFDKMDGSHILELENYEESIAKLIKGASTTGFTRQNVKMFKYNRSSYSATDCWEDVKLEDIPLEGFYIRINRYKSCDKNGNYNDLSYSDLDTFLLRYNRIRVSKGLPKIEIYGIRYKDEKKLKGNGWKEFGEFLKSQEGSIMSKKKIKQCVLRTAKSEISDCSLISWRIKDKLKEEFKDHTIGDYISISDTYNDKNNDEAREIYKFCSSFYGLLESFTGKRKIFRKIIQKNLRKDRLVSYRRKRIEKKYPHVNDILNAGYSISDSDLESFLGYIKDMDELENFRKKQKLKLKN